MDGTIIVLDYSSYERQKIRHILEKIGSFEIMEISGIDQLKTLDTAAYEDPLLVLLDLSFPTEVEGFQVLSRLRETPAIRETPIIIISKSDNPAYKTSALKYSVNDFIVRPYPIKRMENSIRSLVKLEDSFYYDTSQIANINMSFNDFISREFKIAKRTHSPLSLLFITTLRLGGDKAGNGNDSENAGQMEFFSLIAERITDCLRATDIAVTSRDSDMIIILPCTDRKGADLVLDRIQARVSEELQKENVNLGSALFSVLVTYPEDGEGFQSLMESVYKRLANKEMLEKIAQIPANQRKYANRRYNQFNRLF